MSVARSNSTGQACTKSACRQGRRRLATEVELQLSHGCHTGRRPEHLDPKRDRARRRHEIHPAVVGPRPCGGNAGEDSAVALVGWTSRDRIVRRGARRTHQLILRRSLSRGLGRNRGASCDAQQDHDRDCGSNSHGVLQAEVKHAIGAGFGDGTERHPLQLHIRQAASLPDTCGPAPGSTPATQPVRTRAPLPLRTTRLIICRSQDAAGCGTTTRRE